VLRQAGLDPDRDIHTLVRPPGDYGMDLRWLHDGTIDAALVGSTMAPEAIAAEHGWQVLAWVGDHFQIPTVGVAVDPTYIHRDNPAAQAVVRARAHYETFIAPYFTTDGQADLNIGATAITTVTAELGVPATVTAAEFYRTATTTP
jgi:hypothetical protein